MRVDFEDLHLYTGMNHQVLDRLLKNGYVKNMEYYDQIGELDEWFYKSSSYHIYDVMNTRDIGIYEIWYDYIKRRVDRKSTIYDHGAGVGTLEVLLLKRYPASITVDEYNLLCLDFIHWRMHRRRFELSPSQPHYDYVVSVDTIHRLPSDEMGAVIDWLLSLGDRCFLHIDGDTRHPFYNKVPFDVETYLGNRAKSVKNFHGLWDIEMDVMQDE